MTDQVHLPKAPYPRQLTKKETLDSLSHWQSSVRNYFRRSPQYADFFKRATTWDYSQNNYGFNTPNAEDKADNLESMLDTIASFLPGPYISHQITKGSKSMQDVWKFIWDHYGVTPTQSSLLDYDGLHHVKSERYIDLFDKMVYHQMNHLCKVGTNGGSHGICTKDDPLTLSHKNLIAYTWLKEIDPKLIFSKRTSRTWIYRKVILSKLLG